MKHFYITDKTGAAIADNLADECKSCFTKCSSLGKLIESCPKYGGKRRQGIIENNASKTFLCCDTTKTTRLFREKLDALSYAYPDLIIPRKQVEESIRKSEQQMVNRLVHNLTSINAHNIQEIYDLISQEELQSQDWKKLLMMVETEIKRDPKKAAKMFFRIAKNNLHMKSEFSIYRNLDRGESVDITLRAHPIRKVVQNVLYPFFADFSDMGIFINVSESYGKVMIDYETIQIALYHLIENAVKYVEPNSTITIDFLDTQKYIIARFKMISMHVRTNERDAIFQEGYSGQIPRMLGKNGDGIGMWRIRQMMGLNKGSFVAICGNEIIHNKLGVEFSENVFELNFVKAG